MCPPIRHIPHSSFAYVFFYFLQAMDTIETLNPPAFTEYLRKYSNTICGRHPIGILIQVTIKFLMFA